MNKNIDKSSIFKYANSPNSCQENIFQASPVEMDNYFTNEASFGECEGYNECIKVYGKYGQISLSLRRIGEAGGVGERQAGRWVKKWIERGFLKKKQRWNNSLLMWLPTLFNNQSLYKNLKHLFWAVKKLPLSLLAISPQKVYSLNMQYGHPDFQGNVHLIQERNNYYKQFTDKAAVICSGDEYQPIQKESMTMELKPPSQTLINLRLVDAQNRQLQLTKAGMYALSAFPEAALSAAVGKTKAIKGLREPFRYLYKAARDYCTEQQIQPDYAYSKQLFMSTGLDPESPPTDFFKKQAESSVAKPTTQQKYPHGYGKCADTTCTATRCLDESHPVRTRAWAQEEYNRFISRKGELVAEYGEEKASRLIAMVTGLVQPIENSQEVNIIPQGKQTAAQFLKQQQFIPSNLEVTIPDYNNPDNLEVRDRSYKDPSLWEEL